MDDLIAEAIDDFALFIHDIVVFERAFADLEVVLFDAFLRLANRAVEERMFEFLTFLQPDVLDMGATAAPYANELIFLFMGGFFIAAAMERTGLHRRIALGIVSRVGTSPNRLVLGFMMATAFLTMWISNTATAAMMLPVALAVAGMLKPPLETGEPDPFGIGLMLGIAYAASIGGIATLIGTPPNAIMAGAIQQFLGVQIGFGEWMLVGVPIAGLLLPAAWLLLTRVLYRPGELSGDVAGIIAAERARADRRDAAAAGSGHAAF